MTRRSSHGAAEGRALLGSFATTSWTRLTVAIVAATLFSSLVVNRVFAQTPERRVIRVTAERFSFNPAEIVIDEGEEVELRFRSEDTSHGFRLAGTAIKVAIPKRGKGEVTVIFKPERPGRYSFECHRMCGAGHDFMRGEINVRPRASQEAGRAQ